MTSGTERCINEYIIEMINKPSHLYPWQAFSKAEVTAAKQLKEELDAFQERTEQAWKQMRWIEEAVQTGRSQSAGVETLLPVKTFREAVRIVHGNGLRRGEWGREEGERGEREEEEEEEGERGGGGGENECERGGK